MTAHVFLLFIAMIPIDFKIAKFSLYLFVYFLYSVGELTSARNNNNEYYFCKCHTH